MDDMGLVAKEILLADCIVLATPIYATEPFETGVKRLCEHSHLKYIGMYSVRDTDDLASFQTEEAVAGARQFAKELLKTMEEET